MGGKGFHDRKFDDSTLLKLEIFRGYIREWLPVFLAKKTRTEVHIYDFFAGPGTDPSGTPGTPLLILEELQEYLSLPDRPTAPDVQIHLHFNDISSEKIEKLKENIAERENQERYRINYTSMEFEQAFVNSLSSIRNGDTANLIIMDQCGLKEVTERIFQELVGCSATDILFFLSSSTVKRFVNEGSIQQYFPVPIESIRDVPVKEIHRYLCNNFYRKLIPERKEYYVAPFSLEKEKSSNIYGIIFGSGKLLGLDKFMKVCWDKDRITGEANYDIDNDPCRGGQMSFIPEDNVTKKQDRFQKDLVAYVDANRPDNRQVYRFTLENGFRPQQAKGILLQLRREKKLVIEDLTTGASVSACYLTWSEYDNDQPRVRFISRGASNVP